MTCQEFRAQLHDYADETLEPAARTRGQMHLRQCTECQQALQRAEQLGESLRAALHSATQELRLSGRVRREIMTAARATAERRASSFAPWRWLTLHPAPVLGFAATLACIVALSWLMPRPARVAHPPARADYVIDVPLRGETHVFHVRDGKVVDAVVATTLVGHAELRMSGD